MMSKSRRREGLDREDISTPAFLLLRWEPGWQLYYGIDVERIRVLCSVLFHCINRRYSSHICVKQVFILTFFTAIIYIVQSCVWVLHNVRRCTSSRRSRRGLNSQEDKRGCGAVEGAEYFNRSCECCQITL